MAIKRGNIKFQDFDTDLQKFLSDSQGLGQDTLNKLNDIDKKVNDIHNIITNRIVLNVSCNDGHSVLNQEVTVKNLKLNTINKYTLVSSTLSIPVENDVDYKISINDLNEFYKTPDTVLVNSGRQGTVKNINMQYIKNTVTCRVHISCDDNIIPTGQKVTVKNNKTGVMKDYDVLSENLNVDTAANTSYTFSINNRDGYNPVSPVTITTGNTNSNTDVDLTYVSNLINTNVYLCMDHNVENNILDEHLRNLIQVPITIRIHENDTLNYSQYTFTSTNLSIKLKQNVDYIVEKVNFEFNGVKYTIDEQTINTDKTYIYLYKQSIYGCIIDQNNPDPNTRVTYTDDAATIYEPIKCESNGKCGYGNFRGTFIINSAKLCTFENGKVSKYLFIHDDKYPSDKDIMVEFKKTYYKWEDLGDGRISFKVANYKPDSSYCCDAFIDGHGIEKDYMYIGSFLNGIIDGHMSSKYIQNFSEPGESDKYCNNYKKYQDAISSMKDGYCQLNYAKFIYIQFLEILLFKTTPHGGALNPKLFIGHDYCDSIFMSHTIDESSNNNIFMYINNLNNSTLIEDITINNNNITLPNSNDSINLPYKNCSSYSGYTNKYIIYNNKPFTNVINCNSSNINGWFVNFKQNDTILLYGNKSGYKTSTNADNILSRLCYC